MTKAKTTAAPFTVRAKSWLTDETYEVNWDELTDEVRQSIANAGLLKKLRGAVSNIKKGDTDAAATAAAAEGEMVRRIIAGTINTSTERVSERTKLARVQMVKNAKRQVEEKGNERARLWLEGLAACRQADSVARASNRKNKDVEGYESQPQFTAVKYIDAKLETASDGFWKDIDAAIAAQAGSSGEEF